MKTYEFRDIDERNAFLVDCYNKGLKYSYFKQNKEGVYLVTVEE